MFWFPFITIQAPRTRFFIVTVLITNLTIHSAWGKHAYINFFFWHFHSCLLLSTNSYLLSSSLYFTAYRKDSIFYETCRLGTACSARCPQMASPQKGSWRQPAQGKRSVPCMIWSRPWLRKITALRRGAFGERNAPTFGWCIIAPLVN